jgi:predicted aspartyl protease
MTKFNAFTATADGVLRVLQTPCKICEAISVMELKEGKPHPEFKEFVAIWDTGASASAISPRVVEALGLTPTGRGISDTAGGSVPVEKYSINIILPMNVGFSCLQVSCNNMKVDVLIGMDIISMGDFCVTNKEGKTVFSFQTPSSHDIDFTKEIEKYKTTHLAMIKHGNNKCPCGSGKNGKIAMEPSFNQQQSHIIPML